MIATCLKICIFIFVMNCIVQISGHGENLDGKSHEKTSEENNSSSKIVDYQNINLTEIMMTCNESFRVQMGNHPLVVRDESYFY